MIQEEARIVRARTERGARFGVIDGDRIYVLTGESPYEWKLGKELGRMEELPLLAPVLPGKIICVGLNYLAHANESGKQVPSEPLLFFKPPSAVIGPSEAIVLPQQSERVDYEGELAVVMGTSCRNVTPEMAWSCVLGMTCGNDVTARDLQQRDSQWTRAKGFDTFCPLGPWIVTGLNEETAANATLMCRVNGDVRQTVRTSEMVFSIPELIAYISSIMTLEPYDVIMTGTPEGVGPLTPGDVVEVEVEGVGVLGNHVVEETQ